MTVILPPPPPVTVTLEPLVKVTSVLAIPSGKLGLKFSSKLIVPDSDNPPIKTFEPLELITPLVKLMSPPNNAKIAPGDTDNEPLSSGTELLTISSGLSLKFKPIGALIVNKGGLSKSVALNSPSSNKKLSAVLPKNEPPISNLAFGPKRIPAGLSRNKLALPLARSNPSIFEMLPPVTREKILAISAALLKNAEPSVATEKSLKL